jgi:aminoglycoside phosphotransferase (APT) family kinase protein
MERKITCEQLKIICLRHNIKLESHSRLTAGFSHELHRINKDLVLKLYSSNNPHSFKTELTLLASTLPFKKPTLFANSEKDDEIDRDYIIMTYVPGTSLGSIWHLATERQREALIKEICQSLKTIHRMDPAVLPDASIPSWKDYVTKNFENTLIKLRSKNIIDSSTTEKAQSFFYKNVPVLNQSKLYPVFWDIQFDNFIVNNNFELQSIIDLESLELASLDYPLYIIQKQMDEPEKFLTFENEKNADRKDYENLEKYYKKYYPEMFNFSGLTTRLKIYELNNILSLLVNWSHLKENHEKLDKLIS